MSINLNTLFNSVSQLTAQIRADAYRQALEAGNIEEGENPFVDINTLHDTANQLTAQINAETRQLMIDEGIIEEGENPVDALRGQSSSLVSDTMDILTALQEENPDISIIKNGEYIPPSILGTAIGNSKNYIAELEEKMANNPDWKGDRSVFTQEELDIQKTQNTIMMDLIDTMNVLNENTISLPTLLTKIVNSSTESNGLITAMAESINTLQEILLRIELSLNPDNEVEEEVPEEEVPEEQEEEAQQEG